MSPTTAWKFARRLQQQFPRAEVTVHRTGDSLRRYLRVAVEGKYRYAYSATDAKEILERQLVTGFEPVC